MKVKKILFILSVLLITLLSACISDENLKDISDSLNSDETKKYLTVSFIDVGQGDAILMKTPNDKYILVDSGSQNEKQKFFQYLSRQNIGRFEAVIATHPHEDHIGNLDEVITNYDIVDIYMPKVTTTTSTFKNLMAAIKDKNLKIKSAYAGVNFDVDGVKFEFLAPNKSKYDDLNNYSAVLKVTYKDNSFLLMGDAEKLSEEEILKNNFDLKSQVIKIGHHGSSSSTSKYFINSVCPQYAVISCGKNNDYGHPHKETIKLLNDLGIKIFRTDINGTIIFKSDGKNLINSNNN